MTDLIKRMPSTKIFFAVLVFITLVVIAFMLFPDLMSGLGSRILVLWGLFAVSGLALVISVYKAGITGKAKFFLLLPGFAALAFVLGVVLHNAFYALAILAEDLAALRWVLNILGGGFFLIAVMICPIAIIIGIVQTILNWKDIKASKNKA